MEMEPKTLTPAIADLIHSLKTSFNNYDYAAAEQSLLYWAQSVKLELSGSFSDELLLKEVDKIELEFKVSRLEKELGVLREENEGLKEKVSDLSLAEIVLRGESQIKMSELEEEIRFVRRENAVLKERVSDSSLSEQNELEMRISHLEKELDLVRKENAGLKEKVTYLSKIIEKGDKIAQLEKELAMSQTENSALREEVTNLSQTVDGRKEVEKNEFVVPTPSKKQRKRVVSSESESESDDDLPIGRKFNMKKTIFTPKIAGSRKRRLVRLSEMETPGKDTNSFEDELETDSKENRDFRKVKSRKRRRKLCFSETEDEETPSTESPKRKYINLQNGFDSSEEEEESDDSESLSGFIVSGSEPESSNSNSNSSNSNNLSSNSKSSSNFENLDDDVKLKEAVNKITRKKKTNNGNNKWEYEADMLAEFGKKPETCLKAICALYKRQTEEEQEAKSTQVLNKIGFSQFDAERASLMADFLTDGKVWGPVVKSVEELEEFDKYGLEYCERVAMKYSKQLFEMYRENEDPYFGPSLSD